MFNWREKKTPILLVFMLINFALLEVDVLMAHSENRFFRFELIPVIYAPFAVLAIFALILTKQRWARKLFDTSMYLGVVIGILGTFFHLAGNGVSNRQPLYDLLVAGSPVAAPIAFAGLSLFTLETVRDAGSGRRARLLVLAGLGFLGAVIAAFFDHAKLGFVPVYTIIPLISGMLGAMVCFWEAAHSTDKQQRYVFWAVLGLNMATGILGFGFHVLGDWAGTHSLVLSRFLYRDPTLAPLLFCSMPLLGALSVIPEPGDDAVALHAK